MKQFISLTLILIQFFSLVSPVMAQTGLNTLPPVPTSVSIGGEYTRSLTASQSELKDGSNVQSASDSSVTLPGATSSGVVNLSPAPLLTIPSLVPSGSASETSYLPDLDPMVSPNPTLTPSVTSVSSASLRIRSRMRPLAKRHYSATEPIRLTVENIQQDEISVKLIDTNGQDATANIYKEVTDGIISVLFAPTSHFKPGKYTLRVVDATGTVGEQDFTWGVLAINTNKSIYAPGETAKLDMAVLDEQGNMVCDASLALVITNTELNIHDQLTTDNGAIKINAGCNVKAMILEGDYETSYTVGGTGTYKMTLTAQSGSGTFSISDSFEVLNEVSFDVERVSATRIYPPERYPVRLNIIAHEDFEGVITEIVPKNFFISPLSDTLAYDNISMTEEITDSNFWSERVVQLGMPFSGEHPISQKYGDLHDDPYLSKKYKEYGVVGHDGVDFQMDLGTEITAVDDGEIVRARENYDYGTTVVIQHDWGKSYYGHLSVMLVKESDRVKKGDIIALSGNTGLSTNPHLHFGVKPLKNDVTNGYYGKVNPLPYLGVETEDIKTIGSDIRPLADSGVQIITWNVQLLKGESLTLGYQFNMPEVSPEFYLTGPLEFRKIRKNGTGPLVFAEARQWQLAADAVDPTTGWLIYGDTTNAGKVKIADLSDNNPITWGGEVNTLLGGGSTNIYWTKTVADPAGTDIHTAYLDSGGTMYVLRCTGACRTTGNWSELFTVAGVTGTQTCTGTLSNCTRPVDIAYEQLTGRVLIAYGKDATADAFFYRVYNNGSSVIGETQVSDSNLGNDAPTFITLKPRGDRLGSARTNQILLTAMAGSITTANEVIAQIWSGSAWGNSVQLTSSNDSNDCFLIQCADGAWEAMNSSANGTAIVAWPDVLSNIRYKRYNDGTWESDTISGITARADGDNTGIQLFSHPASNRIGITVNNIDLADMVTGVWKTNGTTAGWTEGNTEASMEGSPGFTAWGEWERFSADAFWGASNSAANFDFIYATAVCTGSGCTFSGILDGTDTGTCATKDDASVFFNVGAWNSNEIINLSADQDQNLHSRLWTGTSDSVSSACLEDSLPDNAENTQYAGVAQSFAWDAYKPWSRNWRFYSDITVNDPSVGLNEAVENATPVDVALEAFMRLRVQLIELGDKAQTDTRKKLQYTSGCTPNTVGNEILCSWTDVGDTGETGAVWRYATSAETCSSCSDNTAISTPRLTNSEAGFYISDKDAAGNTAMDHGDAGSATDLIEVDYPLKAENVANSTTYYFRVVDVDTTTELAVNYRRQDTGTTDCLGATCTYPSLTTAAVSGPTLDQLMRHGNWFIGDVEQTFTF